MAIKTVTEQLESVQTAIAAIESGAQSYELHGRSFTKANLETLYKREENLLSRHEAEQGAGPRIRHAEIG